MDEKTIKKAIASLERELKTFTPKELLTIPLARAMRQRLDDMKKLIKEK